MDNVRDESWEQQPGNTTTVPYEEVSNRRGEGGCSPWLQFSASKRTKSDSIPEPSLHFCGIWIHSIIYEIGLNV